MTVTAHPDILDQRDSLKGAFIAAVALHVAIFGGMALRNLLHPSTSFGAPDAGGGAIGIEAVKSIPLIHRGAENPVANDTESQVPQTPAKQKEATTALDASKAAMKAGDNAGCMKHMDEAHAAMGM